MGKTQLKNLGSIARISNSDFLKKVSEYAPEYGSVTAKIGRDVFNEAGFEAVQQLPGGATRFYGIAMLVGAQYVDFTQGRNVLDDIGIIERFKMSLASYIQRNRVAPIRNVNPGWLGSDGTGLKNGDWVNQDLVRKFEVISDYYGLNSNYQNFFTLQRFDLKRGWLTENGIGDIVAQAYNMVSIDRKNWEFALFFHVLSGALNSSRYPLKDTQKLVLTSWTDAAPTDAEINELIIEAKNVAEAMTLTPTFDQFNAAGAPNDAPVDAHVLLVRPGIKAQIEKMLGYAYNRDELQFPFPVKTVANFGGLIPEDANNAKMQEVYATDGTTVGYIDGAATINGPARQVNGQWLVNITSGGATADTTFPTEPDHWEDPNADALAAIAQKGVIFELIQNEMHVDVHQNFRGVYENVFFNQEDNGINYNHTRNLIIIRKPGA